MARFIKCNAKMQRSSDLEEQERIQDLTGKPGAVEVEESFNPICVDFEKVVTYLHHYDKSGEIAEGYCEIMLTNGGYLVIDLDFQRVDKMLRGVDKHGYKEPILPKGE